jgi:hypothetical protein
MTKKVLTKKYHIARVVENWKNYYPDKIKLIVVKRFLDTEKEAEEYIMEHGGLCDAFTILPVYSVEEVWVEDPKPEKGKDYNHRPQTPKELLEKWAKDFNASQAYDDCDTLYFKF